MKKVLAVMALVAVIFTVGVLAIEAHQRIVYPEHCYDHCSHLTGAAQWRNCMLECAGY